MVLNGLSGILRGSKDFKGFWEILRDFTEFYDIFRGFEGFQENLSDY